MWETHGEKVSKTGKMEKISKVFGEEDEAMVRKPLMFISSLQVLAKEVE